MIISNPHQIDVTYSLGVTPVEPMIPRKYTVFPGQHTSVPSIQIGIELPTIICKKSGTNI